MERRKTLRNAGKEEIALYLLSLPRREDSPPLNLDKRIGDVYDFMPFLVVAAVRSMVRVVEALIGHGADLLARDTRGHLAVCRAVHNSHVDVVNVLLEAHAMVRFLVEKWGTNEGALATYNDVFDYYPLFAAVCNTYHTVVAFYLDECGIDVNMTTPQTDAIVLHHFITCRQESKVEANSNIWSRRKARIYTSKIPGG